MIETTTLCRRLLGAELRRLREATGFTLDDAAQVLECDRSKISRIESGHRGMRPKELRQLAAEYGVDENRRYALADLARQTRQRGWWHRYADVLPKPQRELIATEDGAATELIFADQYIPALLHTEAYARSIIQASHATDTPSRQEHLLAAAMARQRVLTRDPTPLQLRVVLGEAAIRHMIGGVEVMRGQLHHLVMTNTEDPNVTIQVLPFNAGAHAGTYGGSFTVLSLPEPIGLAVVHLDTLTGGLHLEHPEDVQRHQSAFEQLTTAAPPAHISNTLLASAYDNL